MEKTKLTDKEISEAALRDQRAVDVGHIAVLKNLSVTDAYELVHEFQENASRKGVSVAELCEEMSASPGKSRKPSQNTTEQTQSIQQPENITEADKE